MEGYKFKSLKKRKASKANSSAKHKLVREYIPPKSDAIHSFAHSACETLAEKTDAPMFKESQTIRWLAQFLELAARVQATYLNDAEQIDKDSQ
jgi:hypothetical protein